MFNRVYTWLSVNPCVVKKMSSINSERVRVQSLTYNRTPCMVKKTDLVPMSKIEQILYEKSV